MPFVSIFFWYLSSIVSVGSVPNQIILNQGVHLCGASLECLSQFIQSILLYDSRIYHFSGCAPEWGLPVCHHLLFFVYISIALINDILPYQIWVCTCVGPPSNQYCSSFSLIIYNLSYQWCISYNTLASSSLNLSNSHLNFISFLLSFHFIPFLFSHSIFSPYVCIVSDANALLFKS